MAQLDDLAQKAQAAKAANDTVTRLQAPDDAYRFQSTPDGVFFGRPIGNLPGSFSRGRLGGGGGLLFACDNPQGVADQLNAIMDKAMASSKATDLAAAQAALKSTAADLATFVATSANVTAIQALAK